MTCWLLDDGPFGWLAQQFDPTWSWPASTLHVAREVAVKATFDKMERRQKLLAMQDPSGAPSIVIHDGNDLALTILYGHLRTKESEGDEDLGEHASIALCLSQLHQAVFVARDKKAVYLALAELGPARVATAFDVWSWLHEQRHITAEQREKLFERTYKQDKLERKVVPWRFQQARMTSPPGVVL